MFYFRLFVLELTRSAASMRPPCPIYISNKIVVSRVHSTVKGCVRCMNIERPHYTHASGEDVGNYCDITSQLQDTKRKYHHNETNDVPGT